MTTKQVIFSGVTSSPAVDGTTELNSLMGNGNASWVATEINHLSVIPTPGKLTNFKVRIRNAPGAGKSWVFTVRAGNPIGDTALSVTISDTAKISALDTDEVAVAAGDLVSISATGSGTPTDPGAVYWTCEFIPDTDGETILLSNTKGQSLTANYFITLIGGKDPDATEFDAQTLFPTPGTLKKFYVELSAAPGAGKSRIFTINKNGVATGIVVTISDAATTGNSAALTSAVAAGDSFSISHTVSGSPAASIVSFGIAFLPDTQGEFMTCATTDNPTSSIQVEYEHLTCGDSALTGTESETHNLARACTAKKIYVLLSTAPGLGNTWIFTLRRNTSDAALTVSISNTNKSGNAAVDVAISNDDVLDTAIDATAGAETSKSQIAYLLYNAPTPPPVGLENKSANMATKMIAGKLI